MSYSGPRGKGGHGSGKQLNCGCQPRVDRDFRGISHVASHVVLRKMARARRTGTEGPWARTGYFWSGGHGAYDHKGDVFQLPAAVRSSSPAALWLRSGDVYRSLRPKRQDTFVDPRSHRTKQNKTIYGKSMEGLQNVRCATILHNEGSVLYVSGNCHVAKKCVMILPVKSGGNEKGFAFVTSDQPGNDSSGPW